MSLFSSISRPITRPVVQPISSAISVTEVAGLVVNGIVFDGDSLTALDAGDGPSYPTWFTTITGIPHDNVGVPGETIEQIGARFSTDAAPLYDPDTRNVYLLMAGANNGNSGADMFDAAAAIMADARAAGFVAWIATPPPRASQPSNIEDYIDLLRADWDTIADGFIDHFEPTPSAGTNGYYLYDGLHQTSRGSVGWAVRTQESLGVAYIATDSTPSAFSFTDTDAATSTPTTSSNVELVGLTAPAAFSVTGGTLVVNGVDMGASGTVRPYDIIAAKGISSATPAAIVDVVVTVGGVSDTFTITSTAPGSTIAWNTTPKAGTATFAESDREVTATSNSCRVICDEPVSGKVIVAMTFETYEDGQYHGLGLTTDAGATTLFSNPAAMYYTQVGNWQGPGAGGGPLNLNLGAGDTLVFAIDTTAKKMWVTKDGVAWLDGALGGRTLAEVGAGTGGKDISAVIDAGTPQVIFERLNFGGNLNAVGTLLTSYPFGAEPSGYTYLGA